MADIQWIKLQTDIFENRKIKMIRHMEHGDTYVVIWMQLLCIAGRSNAGGNLLFTEDIPYNAELLSAELDREPKVIQAAFEIFRKFGMVNISEDLISIRNWEEYQNVNQMEKIREQNRIRKQNQRERDMSRDSHALCHADVTLCHAIEVEEEKEIDISTTTVPTLEEIKAFCKEQKIKANAEKFFKYYSTLGWKDKNGKGFNWKQKLISVWEDKPKRGKASYDIGEIERSFEDGTDL